jgi:septal ring factor EnvC (AmiA/AmiB activator)
LSTVRFPLVEELDNIISNGLKELEFTTYQFALNESASVNSGIGLPVARLDIFRAAFERFIDDMNLYRPFLTAVKREYDAVIQVLYDKYAESVRITQTIKEIEQSHVLTVAERESKYQQGVNALKQEILELQMQLSAKVRENNKLNFEVQKYLEQANKHNDETTEIKNSCALLTNSLVRMEEERKVLIAKDALRVAEVNSATFTSMKAGEEIEKYDRLQQVCS